MFEFPEHLEWMRPVVYTIGGIVAAAAIIGPWLRRHGGEELPETQAHDEPPGTSGHHGTDGTVENPEP